MARCATGGIMRSSVATRYQLGLLAHAGCVYEWFDRVGYTIDRSMLRRKLPDVSFHDFELWAKAQDWDMLPR
jgi:hypothetical protein